MGPLGRLQEPISISRDVGDLLAQVGAETLLEARLDLPNPLAGDAVLVADLLQRDRLLVAHQRLEASLVDHQILPRERLLELRRLLAHEAMILLIGDGVGSLRRPRQKIKQRRVVALGHRRVDGEVAPRQALLHLHDLLLLHAEALGDQAGLGGEPLALEALALLLQVEEELALCLRRPHLHHPPVVHDVADDVGAHPPHRVGREADAAVGIEVLDRLQEPDVALLHEVQQVVHRALILARDQHDEAQVRGHQPDRGGAVLVLVPADGELVLLLARQDGNATDLRQVALQRVGGRDEQPGAAVGLLDGGRVDDGRLGCLAVRQHLVGFDGLLGLDDLREAALDVVRHGAPRGSAARAGPRRRRARARRARRRVARRCRRVAPAP